MTAFVRARPAREIVVEVRVARAGNVAAVVRRSSGPRRGQGEAAVDDDPVGAAELALQRSNVDEWIRCHRGINVSKLYFNHSVTTCTYPNAFQNIKQCP